MSSGVQSGTPFTHLEPPLYGIWCNHCDLPSAVQAVIATRDEVLTIRRCLECWDKPE